MHRIRVPYVHPIVCCTFKRAIRLLPSVLLIAFVLSLIFVTLIQVAVIHSQRRAIYLQRRVNGVVSTASSSPLYAPQSSASAYLSSYGSPNINGGGNSNSINNNNNWVGAGQQQTKGNPSAGATSGGVGSASGTVSAGGTVNLAGSNGKTYGQKLPAGSPSGGPGSTSKPSEPALRIEAILDRNAPSVEDFAVSINNNANAARIRRIFDAVKCHISSNSNAIVNNTNSSNNNINATNNKSNDHGNANNSISNGSSSCNNCNSSKPIATAAATSDVLSGTGERSPNRGTTYSASNNRDDHNDSVAASAGEAGNSASGNSNNNDKADRLSATATSTTTTSTTIGTTTTLSSATVAPREAPRPLAQINDEACGGSNVTLCPEVPSGLRGRLKVDFLDHTADSSWEGASALSTVAVGGCWEPDACIARHRVAIVIPFRDRAEHLQLLLQHLHPILQRQMLSYKVFVIEQYGNDTFNKGVLLNAGAREALQDAKDYECLVFHDVDLIPEDDRNLYSCPTLPRHMSVAVDKFNYTLPYVQLVGGVFSVTVRDFVQLNGYSNLYWGWGGEDDDMAHRMTFIRMASYRMNRDGLTTAKYIVMSRHATPLYTKVVVDIGHNHKWHFANPQKLIVNL
ncbi:mucin-19-like isoform X2 [Varroa destructor]|uniref:Beta-1,4-N-acetylgalactosaminyltransferase bre-4 n=1 Tax=Varroa destructor TaxID=109461 RepID=A0A7M7M3K9_VARDE|nr:mucin-19-like isoform X2 [Varroa destructor]